MGERISVGVTGHRVFNQSGSCDFAQSLSDILSLIESKSVSGLPVLYSGLADGADCEVAVAALLRGWGLVAVLASSEAEFALEHETSETYEKLLKNAQSVVIAAPPGTASPQRYCMVGERIIEHVEHLIAVWDGDTSDPKAGGTTWVVDRFRSNGLRSPEKLHHIKVTRI